MFKIALIFIVCILINIACQISDRPKGQPKDQNQNAKDSQNNGKGKGQEKAVAEEKGIGKGEGSKKKGDGRGMNATFVRLKKVRKSEESFGQTIKREHKSRSGKPEKNKAIEDQLFSNTGDLGKGDGQGGRGNRLLVDAAVQSTLNTFQSSPPIPTYDTLSATQLGPAAGRTCKFESMRYSSPTNEFLHASVNFTDIFPGSVIMSKNLNGVLDGSLAQVGIPASPTLKNPNIKIYDQLTPSVFTSPYNAASINQKISQTIADSVPLKNDYVIYFEMGSTDDLSDFANRVNFNRALFKQIGIDVNASLPLTSYKKKFIFVFTKPLGTFSAIIQSPIPNLPHSPLNTFYSPALTLSEFKSKNPSWWSSTNPPVYIDSVLYGSILILTVDYNAVTSGLYRQFQLQAEKGPAAAQPILNEIIGQPSLQVFSRGPFNAIEIEAIRNGDWLDFMLEVPNSITNSFIQPLSYSVKSFKQARYNGANQFNYIKVCAP